MEKDIARIKILKEINDYKDCFMFVAKLKDDGKTSPESNKDLKVLKGALKSMNCRIAKVRSELLSGKD